MAINRGLICLLVCSFVLSLALVANTMKPVYFNKKVTPDDIMRVLGGMEITNMDEFTKA